MKRIMADAAACARGTRASTRGTLTSSGCCAQIRLAGSGSGGPPALGAKPLMSRPCASAYESEGWASPTAVGPNTCMLGVERLLRSSQTIFGISGALSHRVTPQLLCEWTMWWWFKDLPQISYQLPANIAPLAFCRTTYVGATHRPGTWAATFNTDHAPGHLILPACYSADANEWRHDGLRSGLMRWSGTGWKIECITTATTASTLCTQ